MSYDVFISHASEDKQEIAQPLKTLLTTAGLNVWLDETELGLGDSLRAHLDSAMSRSRYAVVIISRHYMEKTWTNSELAAFFSLENKKRKKILPVRHKVTHEELLQFSPMLADRICVSTDDGLRTVAEKIARVVHDNSTSAELFWNRKPIVLGISGASCSGKTWLAEKFQQLYPGAVTLFDLDGYYKDRTYVQSLDYRHDNPSAINFENAIADLVTLKSGRSANLPTYDFETHRVSGSKTCDPAPIILVEGLFAFANDRFRRELDVKVWITAAPDRCLERRFERDAAERGRDPSEVLERYKRDVQPGFEKYIRPMRDFADVVLLNDGRNKDTQPLIVEMLVAYLDRFGSMR
jgi:uridine kinase